MKRLFDITFSFVGLIILFPFLILISVVIMLSSKGSIFYIQKRVGYKGQDFNLIKFRTMKPGADSQGLLTVGGRDPRITGVGYFLRKYKLDELPQLVNVLIGDMSLVGPRPEVRKYVDLYTDEQRKVLNLKPGITDYASIEYFDENDLIARSKDPEQTYIKEIMPAKIKLNLKYMSEVGVLTDLKLIFKTFARILS